jgi:photosynthetic reaction center cytochrome c subunit
MVHFSNSLGVNCTYCHNTRSMGVWDTSPLTRTTAWYGIRMVRNLNQEFLEPLAPTFPAERKGPLGDGPKLSCATCHQGAYKPLLGVSMLGDYAELSEARPQPQKKAALAPAAAVDAAGGPGDAGPAAAPADAGAAPAAPASSGGAASTPSAASASAAANAAPTKAPATSASAQPPSTGPHSSPSPSAAPSASAKP